MAHVEVTCDIGRRDDYDEGFSRFFRVCLKEGIAFPAFI
jgi:hypothetical protein